MMARKRESSSPSCTSNCSLHLSKSTCAVTSPRQASNARCSGMGIALGSVARPWTVPDLNHCVASCSLRNSVSEGTSTTFVFNTSSGRRMACGVLLGETRSAPRARNFPWRPLGGARGLPMYFAMPKITRSLQEPVRWTSIADGVGTLLRASKTE